MSIKVIKCPSCKLNYNGTQYEECPYCTSGKTGQNINSDSDSKKPGTFFDRFKKTGSKKDTDQSEIAKENTVPVGGEDASSNPVEGEDDLRTTGFIMMPDDKAEDGSISKSAPEPAENMPITEPEPTPVPTPVPNPVPKPPADGESIQSRIDQIGQTIAKYVSYSDNEITYPVVGWLVCVKGIYYGKAFPLKSGMNNVGRSETMDIALTKDMSVSSKTVVRIAYDSKGKEFNALPADSSSLCYVNGKALYERRELKNYDEIELGDLDKNKFIFMGLCGQGFDWDKYPAK